MLAKLQAMVAPGVTTIDIDGVAEALVREAGAEPAFKGYHGYPATVCASVNEQVVHGIPSTKPLERGDIVSIDMGAVLDGFFGDCAVTVPVGGVSAAAQELLRVTEESLFRGIDAVKPGARVSDIGAAVQQHVEARGFRWCGSSSVTASARRCTRSRRLPTTGPPGKGPRLSEGMVLAIEPMVNAGGPAVKVLSDGWTAVTRDGSLSAHFEHTVVVTRDGCEILTLLADDAQRARQLMGATVSDGDAEVEKAW